MILKTTTNKVSDEYNASKADQFTINITAELIQKHISPMIKAALKVLIEYYVSCRLASICRETITMMVLPRVPWYCCTRTDEITG